ncbi:unnamed protein product [Clonostachys rhizophaga]|uniref:Uncharacterized protein n=1 Tax=Clonostachys rhizophaga TaxID=160324 RepID=A0A9N9VAY0_9HYPO|nr:unnamed protein product [Clonostachys rhizophaga]
MLTSQWHNAILVPRQRINLPGIYLFLSYTGARPAEIVDNEKQKPKDGSHEEFWDERGGFPDDEEPNGAVPDMATRILEEILTQETEGRECPKALCYEYVHLMVVRHPETHEDVLAMGIRLVHHKGADNKLKPSSGPFSSSRPRSDYFFCPILILISLALADGAFAARGITSASHIFQLRNT